MLLLLSLQSPTIKTATLLALKRPCREVDLAELDFSSRPFVPEVVVFQSSPLSKQSCPLHHNVAFPCFKEDKLSCPLETLKAYEKRTVSLCSSLGESHLF